MFVQLREINVAYRFVQTGTDAVSAPLDISHTVTLECNLQFKSNKNKANCFSFSKMIYFSLQIQLNSRPTFCLSFQPFIRAWSSRQSTFFLESYKDKRNKWTLSWNCFPKWLFFKNELNYFVVWWWLFHHHRQFVFKKNCILPFAMHCGTIYSSSSKWHSLIKQI